MKLLIKGVILTLATIFLWLIENTFDISFGLLILIYICGMMNIIIFNEIDELFIQLSLRKKSIK